MPYPLVLINGQICEEPPADVGLYPYLQISSGVLIAGGTSDYKIHCINGVLVQVLDIVSPGGVIWDNISAAVWDSGATSWGTDWDKVAEAIWDSGNSAWS